MGKAWQLIAQMLGRKVELAEFHVSAAHFNVDLAGLRLDGVKAVTLQDLDGWLARLYQKGDGVRVEYVTNGGVVTLEGTMSLLQQCFDVCSMGKRLASIEDGVVRVETTLSTMARQAEGGGSASSLLRFKAQSVSRALAGAVHLLKRRENESD